MKTDESEGNATRKDSEDERGRAGRVPLEASAKGNFVDATFPAGDAGAVSQAIEPRKRARRLLRRTEKRSPKLPEMAMNTRYDVRAPRRLLSNVNTV